MKYHHDFVSHFRNLLENTSILETYCDRRIFSDAAVAMLVLLYNSLATTVKRWWCKNVRRIYL